MTSAPGNARRPTPWQPQPQTTGACYSWQLGGLTLSHGWQPRTIPPARGAELLWPTGHPLSWRQANVEQILRAPWDLLYLAAGDRPLHTAPFQGWRLALDPERLCPLVVERAGHRLSPGRCRRRLLSSHALHLRCSEAQGLGTALRQLLLLTQGLQGAALEALINAGAERMLLDLIGQLLCGDLIAKASQQRPTARGSKVQIVDDLLAWIATHLDQPILLADLEAQSGYSQRSLRNIFHERFGCGPVQWIRQQRLELARRQLLSPSPGATVSTVAAACGYEHLSQFSRDFRAAHGQRPSELLREGRRGQPG